MTSFRIIIKRRFNKSIYLWGRFNGSYDCTGRDICYEICDLLEEYDDRMLLHMIEEIEMCDIDIYSHEQQHCGFDPQDLGSLIKHKKDWYMNKNSKVDFEYIIDPNLRIVTGQEIGKGPRIILSFNEIRKNMTFLKKYLDNDKELFDKYLNLDQCC